MKLTAQQVRAILAAKSAQPEEIEALARNWLEKECVTVLSVPFDREALGAYGVTVSGVPVCLQPIQDMSEPDAYAVRILDDRTGDERALIGWFKTAEDAITMARAALDGEREVGCNDLMEVR